MLHLLPCEIIYIICLHLSDKDLRELMPTCHDVRDKVRASLPHWFRSRTWADALSMSPWGQVQFGNQYIIRKGILGCYDCVRLWEGLRVKRTMFTVDAMELNVLHLLNSGDGQIQWNQLDSTSVRSNATAVLVYCCAVLSLRRSDIRCMHWMNRHLFEYVDGYTIRDWCYQLGLPDRLVSVSLILCSVPRHTMILTHNMERLKEMRDYCVKSDSMDEFVMYSLIEVLSDEEYDAIDYMDDTAERHVFCGIRRALYGVSSRKQSTLYRHMLRHFIPRHYYCIDSILDDDVMIELFSRDAIYNSEKTVECVLRGNRPDLFLELYKCATLPLSSYSAKKIQTLMSTNHEFKQAIIEINRIHK